MNKQAKIIIFGNSGSGKSTLAKKLAKARTLSHLDLDTLAWLPSNPPMRAPLEESRRKIETFMVARPSWVIEGCYSDLLEMAAPEASEIIFLNLEVAQCVENARQRPWEAHKYSSPEAQNENLAMLIRWIEDYYERQDVFSFEAHRAFFEGFPGPKTEYRTNQRED